MEGFIPLSRALLDWDWHDEPKTAWLYVVMLMLANHEETLWRGETLRRGQLLTGRHQLSMYSGLSEREVRTALEHLKKTGDVDVESRSKYSIVTMLKYDAHCPADQQTTGKSSGNRPADDQQNVRETTGSASDERPASDQQPTTSKNLKNLKRDTDDGTARKRFVPPTVAEVAAYCAERGNGIDAQQFVDHYEVSGWRRGKTPIKDWKACVRTWEQSDRRKGQEEGVDPYAGMQWF